ncbi:hypothetical protein [Clostridium sp. YIM B02555]|uniref:MORN repeat-containing protein n=1 Tax=Clostridium sp. YIM B02555 TaxID=2911968 RepID=UPI001EED8009|nr:hypothetical protein [Clostridium sp. YIM B02555]
MDVLLGIIFFFSFLGLIGTTLIFIYSKFKRDNKFEPKKLLKIIKGLAIVFVVSLVLGGMVGGHNNDTKAVQAQAQQEQNDGNVKDKAINSGKYTGTLKNGKREGDGTFTASNGDTYKGEWKDDKMNGQGILNYANGDVYSGNYEKGLRSGKGTFTWKESKDTYNGDWKADTMSGQGVYEFGSGENVGDKYNGEWNNNKMEGKGTYTFKDAKTLAGTWKDNKCISESR